MKYFLHLQIIAIILLLGGCASRYQSPVSEVDASQRFLTTDRTHRVNSGETLYTIAMIYDLDINYLARINRLAEPFTIFTEQILNVDPRVDSSLIPPGQSASQDIAVANTSPPQSARVTTRTTPRKNVSLRWQWPSSGQVINHFSNSNQINKGIDIAGSRGDSVYAAASGEIVYAGSGLLRYGELVIIKHNEQYLSAYAHNSKIIVSEGTSVAAGEKIAELGATGIEQEMLHFEIREIGKPVDPLLFLPAR